jgi:Leu/Phe-tRNA-protein transferase
MKKLNERFEIRINRVLIDQLTQVAKVKNVKPSEFIRQVIKEEYSKQFLIG